MDLSKRLKRVADFVDANSFVLADIGSDHAYLPIYLIEQQKIKKAIAGEVITGPFKHAVDEVKKAGLEHAIDVRMGDGLEVIEAQADQVDVITICGMGGDLIAKILDRGLNGGHLTGKEQLILQPNVAEKIVRQWLMANHYQIVDETIVKDKKKFYEIIVATKSSEKMSYTDYELKYGIHLENKTIDQAAFAGKWQEQIDKLEYILSQVQKSNQPQQTKIDHLKAKIKEIEELISHDNR